MPGQRKISDFFGPKKNNPGLLADNNGDQEMKEGGRSQLENGNGNKKIVENPRFSNASGASDTINSGLLNSCNVDLRDGHKRKTEGSSSGESGGLLEDETATKKTRKDPDMADQLQKGCSSSFSMRSPDQDPQTSATANSFISPTQLAQKTNNSDNRGI